MSERRLKSCVENWPDCEEGTYDPRCCRFPKSCSCTVYRDDIDPAKLEPLGEYELGDTLTVPLSAMIAATEANLRADAYPLLSERYGPDNPGIGPHEQNLFAAGALWQYERGRKVIETLTADREALRDLVSLAYRLRGADNLRREAMGDERPLSAKQWQAWSDDAEKALTATEGTE